MNSNELNHTIIDSIGKENLGEYTKDILEIGVDSIMTDSILKDIPAIGTLINLSKVGVSIRDGILAKKIIRFLDEVDNIGYFERKEFIENISYDKKYRVRVGESLIMLLEKMDDLEKPHIMGRLFNCTIKKQIDYEMFLRLSSIVVRSFSPDLIALQSFAKGRSISEIAKENLSNQGLLSAAIKKGSEVESTILGLKEKETNKLDYQMNSLGALLIKFGFND